MLEPPKHALQLDKARIRRREAENRLASRHVHSHIAFKL